MNDIFLAVAWPRNILSSRRQRRTDRMEAGHNPLLVFFYFAKNRGSDPRHNSHVDHCVCAVSKLDSQLRHRRSNWPHRVWQNIHGATVHAAMEQGLQLAPHGDRMFPIIRGSSVVFGQGADEGSILDASYVIGRRPSQETTRPKLLIEPRKGPRIYESFAELLLFLGRTVDPLNRRGLAKICHLFHPSNQM